MSGVGAEGAAWEKRILVFSYVEKKSPAARLNCVSYNESL
jgi:hypothetical protein